MRSLVLALVVCAPGLVLAQDTANLPRKPDMVAVPSVTAAPAPTSVAVEDADPTTDTVVQDAVAAAEAAGTLKTDLKAAENRTGKLIVVAGFLAAIIKLLLSLAKILGANAGVSWFVGKDGKRLVKYMTLVLGALTGLIGNLGFGLSVVESFMLALSGPLSVAVHEYTKDSKDTIKVA